MRKLCLIISFILSCSGLWSQTISASPAKTTKDSLPAKDPMTFYRNIYRLANKSLITRLLYASILKEPPAANSTIPTANGNSSHPSGTISSYKQFEGKTIGSIHIIILDPLGKVQDDTLTLPGNFLNRTGNKVHVKSRQFVIRNKLLFAEGDVFDSLKLKESERIIHQSPGIRDAKIRVECNAADEELLKVLIVVRDYWSINGELIANISSNFLSASDNNFLGYSHVIQNRLSYSLNNPNSLTLIGNYAISNIRNTFISANLYYTCSSIYKNIGLSLDRPFISPLTRWAGGINLNPVHTFWTTILDGRTTSTPLVFRTEDVWLGRSFALTKGKTHSWIEPRLVLTGRIYDMHYTSRPDLRYDPLRLNQNSTLYLGGVGISNRNYYKDVNIYRFGATEVVPEGRLVSFTAGYRKSDILKEYYCGVKLAGARHIKHIGYLAELVEYGTFLQNSRSTKGALNAELKFLSDQIKYENWNIRAFGDLKSTLGYRRDAGESLNINGSNGLTGFNSDLLTGNCRTVLNLAFVFYSPYKFMEFQFAGIIFTGFGRLSDTPLAMASGPVYRNYGLGLLIRNENLVLSTIQLSINFYPQIPGRMPNSFQFNPSSIPDIRFSDFYLSKADVVAYQ